MGTLNGLCTTQQPLAIPRDYEPSQVTALLKAPLSLPRHLGKGPNPSNGPKALACLPYYLSDTPSLTPPDNGPLPVPPLWWPCFFLTALTFAIPSA